MLLIDKYYITKVQDAIRFEDLYETVQKAIELEHSTIPVYLTALFSIKPGSNREVYNIINSVVKEEMLHMSIIANIMNAIGGTPIINKPDFIPKFPGHLPMNINQSLYINLKRLSKAQVKNTFMKIEQPEKPLKFPERNTLSKETIAFATIGQFYRTLKMKIEEIAIDELPGDPTRQVVTDVFNKNELFPILRKDDAIKGIEMIIEQGEGTDISPLDLEKEVAHYYRFKEIYKGKKLVKDNDGSFYYGPELPFDKTGVYPISANTKLRDIPENTPGEKEVKQLAKEFAFTYTRLLNGLHRAFNGEPKLVETSLGLMFDLKFIAQKLAACPFPKRTRQTIGPPFEFVMIY